MGIHIQERLVPDPMMTDAEFLHQKAQEAERAEKRGRPTNLDVGKVKVEENAMTRIGALCFIRRRLHHHEQAAEWFKTAYEGLYGGGMSPAIDMGKLRVDTSILAHDNGAVARLDRGKKLTDLIMGRREGDKMIPPMLAKEATDRIVSCVVLGIKCEDGAAAIPSGQANWRHVKREVDALLDDLDTLSTLLGYRTRAA